MGGPEYGWLIGAVSDFGQAYKDKLSGPGGPEAVIRRPIEDLLQSAGRHYGLKKVLWHDETRLDELGVRPDYAVQVDGAIIGYLPTEGRRRSSAGRRGVKRRMAAWR